MSGVKMKICTRIMLCFNIVIKAVGVPVKLSTQSLQTIKQTLDEETVDIISGIYPKFFDDQTSLKDSGRDNILNVGRIQEKEIDLSNRKFERIPIPLAKQMSNIEKLNLSNNTNLKLNEEWFSYFFNNLKELSVNNCNHTDENLEAIAKIKSLERLNISGITQINIRILRSIFKNLKHLNISSSKLSIPKLKYILNHADKLESLNFSEIDLSKLADLFDILSKKTNLKILELSNCGLRFENIQNIFGLSSLEEIDLSYNNLGNLEEKKPTITNNTASNHEDLIENKTSKILSLSPKLKKINLKYCHLKDNEFLRNLFDLENLEVLNLTSSSLDYFNLKEILNGKAKNSLKELNVSYCKIKEPETLRDLTDFPNLEKLDISYNLLSEFPHDFKFGQSKNSLKDINLGQCNLNGTVFKNLEEFTCLEKLDLSLIDLSNTSPFNLNLEKLKKTLKHLILRGSSINRVWFYLLTDFKLVKLDLSETHFSSPLNQYFLGSSIETLKEINLKSSKINHEILFKITDCRILEILNVSNNNFEGISEDFKFGRSKRSLKELYIENSKLDKNGLLAISKCNRIEKLWISRNNLSDLPNNFSFGSLANSLKELCIFSSKIDFLCLRAINGCTKLEILDIRHNSNSNMNDNRIRDIIESLERRLRKLII